MAVMFSVGQKKVTVLFFISTFRYIKEKFHHIDLKGVKLPNHTKNGFIINFDPHVDCLSLIYSELQRLQIHKFAPFPMNMKKG